MIPCQAFAVQLEAGAGVNFYRTENGRWYQEGLPHSLKKITPSFSIGIVGNVLERENWGIDWHLGYVNLGVASAYCYCTSDDNNYNGSGVKDKNGPMATFTGTGRMQGIVATVEPYFKYGSFRYGLELGAIASRSSWVETIYGWPGNPSRSQDDRTIQVSTSPKINPGLVFGVTAGHGNIFVSYRLYLMTGQKSYSNPPLWRGAHTVEIKYRF